MTLSLQPASWNVYLQELVVPYTMQFSSQAGDLSSCTAVAKVRQTLASTSSIITLVSPTDIQLGTDGTITVTFTSAHFTTLLASLTAGDGVYDVIVTPLTGAPQMAAAGSIGVRRTVSR
jgi:aromatic ring-cleaving dioxygenase